MVLLSLLLLFSAFSFADDCAEVRLDKHGGVMEKVPAFDQGSYGTCFAVAATQVYDAYRIKQNPKSTQQSSVFHAAMLYAIDSKDPHKKLDFNVDGGYPDLAVKHLINQGSCERNAFDKKLDVEKFQKLLGEMLALKQSYDASKYFKERDNFKPYNPGPYKGLDAMSSHYSNLNRKINADISMAKQAYEKNPACLITHMQELGIDANEKKKLMDLLYRGEMEKFKAELQVATCPKNSILKTHPVPKISSPDFYDIELARAISRNYDKYIKEHKLSVEEWSRLTSEANRKLDAVTNISNSPKHRSKVIKKWVAEKLKKNGMPVSISYCSNKIGTAFNNLFSDDCGAHASVIIGRKKNPSTGRCQLLIRNSWGKNPWLTYNKHVTGEGNNFWVDEDRIYSSSRLDVFTLE